MKNPSVDARQYSVSVGRGGSPDVRRYGLYNLVAANLSSADRVSICVREALINSISRTSEQISIRWNEFMELHCEDIMGEIESSI